MPQRDLLKVLQMSFYYLQLTSISQALLKGNTEYCILFETRTSDQIKMFPYNARYM